MDDLKMVTITEREYQELRRNSAMLEALKNCGVEDLLVWDNAVEEFNENYDEEDYEI